jgi:hypothetical protein
MKIVTGVIVPFIAAIIAIFLGLIAVNVVLSVKLRSIWSDPRQQADLPAAE